MKKGQNCAIVDVPKGDSPEVWSEVKQRVAESLPDFEVKRIERVQNRALWRQLSSAWVAAAKPWSLLR